MRITNKKNLPQAFVEMAGEEREIRENVYSVTTLLKGTRELILQRRYSGQVEQDVSDMIWLLFGTAVHSILDRQKEKHCEIKEERLEHELFGSIVSGQFDLYNADEKKITDYKTASVWKIIYKSFEDWETQLSMYAYLLELSGFEVQTLEIVALLKDHSKRDAKHKAGYPQLPVEVVTFSYDELSRQRIESFIECKLAEIKRAEKLDDEELPLCTPEQRYNSGDRFAVMKGKNKRAVRVLNSEEDALEYIQNTGKGDRVEIRPGEDKKCADYCSVNKFCGHWREQNEHLSETTRS